MSRTLFAILTVLLASCAVQPLPPEGSFGPQDTTSVDAGADLTAASDVSGTDGAADVPDISGELPDVAVGDATAVGEAGEIGDDDADSVADSADSGQSDDDAVGDEMVAEDSEDTEDVADSKVGLDLLEVGPADTAPDELVIVDVLPPPDAADAADAVDTPDVQDILDVVDAADVADAADAADAPADQSDVASELPIDAAKSDAETADGASSDGKGDTDAADPANDGANLCLGVSSCDDGNPCTTEKCDSALGCVYQSNADPCDDLNPCTEKDKCKVAKCVGTPVNCDDGNVCTTEVCVEKFGCFKSVNNLPCSDDNPCTVGDNCKDGTCAGKAVSPDADNDGLTSSVCGGPDCDDSNPKVHPGAIEDCATVLVDDNCNGKVDEENALGCVSYFFDGDSDGYGASGLLGKCLCKIGQAQNYTAKVSGDCDDAKAAINPAALELCNPSGIDENCNGVTDEICPCPKPGFAFPACTSCGDGWLLIPTNAGDVCAPLFPVWGIQALSPNTLIANADGTISDSLTTLTWEKSTSTVPMHWGEAKNYCKAQLTAGKNNWRLPTTAELHTIVDFTKFSPAGPAIFGFTPSEWFWTAVPVTGAVNTAWVVGFGDGYSNIYDVGDSAGVRCVR